MPNLNAPNFLLPAPTKSKEIIRVSIPCLCRLIHNDKYSLIINNDGTKYQPIGGCYHYNEEIRKHLQEEFGFNTDEERWPEPDLRGKLPRNKLYDFIRWFNDKKKNRENTLKCAIREIEEELKARGLPFLAKYADSVDWVHLWNSYEKLSFENKWECEVTRYLHIIDIVSPSEFLSEIYKEGLKEDKLFLASEEEIKNINVSNCFIRGKRISLHTVHLVRKNL